MALMFIVVGRSCQLYIHFTVPGYMWRMPYIADFYNKFGFTK